jgi:hypothetical protein
VEQSRANRFATVNWHNRAASVLVPHEMMTPSNSKNNKTSAPQRVHNLPATQSRQARHTSHNDPLHPNEFRARRNITFYFQAQFNRFPDPR